MLRTAFRPTTVLLLLRRGSNNNNNNNNNYGSVTSRRRQSHLCNSVLFSTINHNKNVSAASSSHHVVISKRHYTVLGRTLPLYDPSRPGKETNHHNNKNKKGKKQSANDDHNNDKDAKEEENNNNNREAQKSGKDKNDDVDGEKDMTYDPSSEVNREEETGRYSNEFVDEAVVVQDEHGNYITRVRAEPLSLVEEVPLPQRVYTDLELIMMAWTEEHARHYAILMIIIRFSIFILLSIILYVFYRTQLSSERVVRGVDNVPRDLRIGNVVYFDITEDGREIGRVVIGLLNENCPLYCEYFHRKCTGNGDNDPGNSFRGMPLAALVPKHALVFGDGREMTHDVPGFNPHFLPTEHLGKGAWRGALSSIAYGPDRESPNFAIHVSAGDYHPQIFGIIMGGYNVIERINASGSKHGNTPKRGYMIQDCGELCTLAKSHIVPMPWKLYNNVSVGYDEEKFGPKCDPEILRKSDERWAVKQQDDGSSAPAKKKRFFFF